MGGYDDTKEAALRKNGTFNARAGAVSDELFCGGEFFDPRDLVQVKYEMLRRAREEGLAVSRAAEAFGFSRVAFYQIQRAYAREGLAGLLPRRRGPKRAHKITGEVVDFLLARLASDASLRADGLVDLVRERFGLRVHPRSIERALERRKKKGALIVSGLDAKNGSLGYERLRDVALADLEVSRARWGLSLFMNRGFFVWIKTWIEAEETSSGARFDERTDATDPSEEIALPDAVQGRMVTVLAGMVLGALREEVA